jgi:hypothetical protein
MTERNGAKLSWKNKIVFGNICGKDLPRTKNW